MSFFFDDKLSKYNLVSEKGIARNSFLSDLFLNVKSIDIASYADNTTLIFVEKVFFNS